MAGVPSAYRPRPWDSSRATYRDLISRSWGVGGNVISPERERNSLE
jgi:hypothetical protein